MAGRGRRSAGRGSVSRLLSALEYSVSAAQGSQLGPHHAQIVLELLEPGLILTAERLNLAVERLQLPLGRGQLRGVLVAEDPHLIDEELDPLLDLGDVGREGCRTALLAAVNLVEASDQHEDAGHREHDRKPQSQVPAAHAAKLLEALGERIVNHTRACPDRIESLPPA